MMYYCHKCGYLGKGRGKKKVARNSRLCCNNVMQRISKETAKKVQDERLKENT